LIPPFSTCTYLQKQTNKQTKQSKKANKQHEIPSVLKRGTNIISTILLTTIMIIIIIISSFSFDFVIIEFSCGRCLYQIYIQYNILQLFFFVLEKKQFSPSSSSSFLLLADLNELK